MCMLWIIEHVSEPCIDSNSLDDNVESELFYKIILNSLVLNLSMIVYHLK